MFNDFGNAEFENSGEKTSSGWSGWGLTGVIFSGVGGMLALLPHPFSKVIGYGMMSIGGAMQVYDIKLMAGQYLGANSKVMKTKNTMDKIYREREKELKKNRILGNEKKALNILSSIVYRYWTDNKNICIR
jgi:hypothetical protein